MAKVAYISPTARASSPRCAVADRQLRSHRSGSAPTPANDHALRWLHITKVLAACGGGDGAARCMLRRTDASGLSFRDCNGRNATIEILDRPSATSAVLSWRDPTGSSYGYQLWQKRTAKEAGSCALTGVPIRRGDYVFLPGRMSVRPANATAMILAIHIEQPLDLPARLSQV
jgi:uncharacterized protein YfiM (DUF2279 family)